MEELETTPKVYPLGCLLMLLFMLTSFAVVAYAVVYALMWLITCID